MSPPNAPVRVETDGGVAVVTLDRPAALNALDLAMADALFPALQGCADDPEVRCVVLRGAGEHFMAGGDLKAFARFLDEPPAARRERFARLIEGIHRSVALIRAMPKPVVASVRGAAAGFGVSLALACDLAVAADDAYFTLAYCHIGTSPDGGATFHLPRAAGLKRAMEMALLGDRFGAEEARRMGLVNRVVPAAALEAETAALSRRLASGPTLAHARTKRLLNESFGSALDAQLRAEAESFAASAATDDFAEGIRAFVEKRRPAFRGS